MSPKLNSQACLRLFCFPFAGGAASVFRTWPNYLPAKVEVCPVQLPGRESRLREKPFILLAPLVEAISSAMLPLLNKPFAFYGHSMGALLAFELARKLREQRHRTPALLFIAARYAPQVPHPDPPLYNLPDAEFIEKLREFNGTPDELLQNPEVMSVFMPTLRADFAVNETYEYVAQDPLECPISAFGGLQDNRIPREMIEPWREQTRSGLKLRMLPGNHFFLIDARRWLLEAIWRDLLPFLR